MRVPGYAACGYYPRPDWGDGSRYRRCTAGDKEGRRAIYALFVAGPCLTGRVYDRLAWTVAQVVGKPQISPLLTALMSTPRRAQHRQRFGAIETPVIEGAAGDRAFELARARLG